jgi:DNA topoisomerase-1
LTAFGVRPYNSGINTQCLTQVVCMADKLVIVESNAKAKTISRYLGKGYEVRASRGHVRDLPEDKFGVDVENDFEPTYRTMPGSRRIVGQLRKLVDEDTEVFLAPDPDREGEAIAWHLKHVLDLPDDRIHRVTFNEITRGAVRNAFDHPREIDLNLVNAQQARRILDRIVGYELSPLISKKIVRGLSAGRVQSVALRLVVERERERDAFEPEEYWEIKALLSRDSDADTFEAELKKVKGEEAKVSTGDAAKELVARIEGETFRVQDVSERSTSSKASPPFITSTMQQAAYSRLRMRTSQTMRLAQQLYEGVDIGDETVGLITYMRTDSTRVAQQALDACRTYIGEQHGDKYLPKKPNTFRSPKSAQAAHEAIRPSDPFRTPDKVKAYLSDKQFKLYDLIWRRFVASQMTPARYQVTTADISAGDCTFVARGRRMVFDGHTAVSGGSDDSRDQLLPELASGDELVLHGLEPSQHFTQPPPRFTEASIVKELERLGIGRPSTYAPTISTLLRRNYVRRVSRALSPTDLGMVVTDLLVEHFPREMDVAFTSRMEDELDEVEEGARDWRSALHDFYDQFARDLEKARDNMQHASELETPDQETCPECGKAMVVKFSRKGDKFLGCSGFPECKYTVNIEREGEEGPVETEFKCDKCGAPMLRRIGRRGREYLACSAYPECENIMGLDREGKPVKLKPRITTGLQCPRCGQEMHLEKDGSAEEMICGRCRNRVPMLSVRDALEQTEIPEDEPLALCENCNAPMQIKRSRSGLFLGCSKYPECKTTSPMPKNALPDPQPTFERCEKCGRPLIMRWGQYGRFLACSGFPRCRNLWKVPARGRKCPEEGCEGRLMKKVSPEGETYLGCNRYPECEHTEPAPEPKARKQKGGDGEAEAGAAKGD